MERKRDINGVEYYCSDMLCGTRHAFSTRIGGVSRNTHTASLNLGFGRGDDDADVCENFALFSRAVGFDMKRLVTANQVHCADVIYVDDGDVCGDDSKRAFFECDGFVTDAPGVTLGVRTADCVPILLAAYNESGKVVCVGAVHAGWRGSVLKIAARALEKMVFLGAEKESIRAAIGPCIHSCCYEVREDFREAVICALGANAADRYLVRRTGDTWSADIVSLNRDIITDCGVPCDNIDVSSPCTCCNPSLFYSHRYSHGMRGSMLSVIEMPGL
ncbi:MAG: peptidoglycan editing factor PgeF [Eubacteriales bacterium]